MNAAEWITWVLVAFFSGSVPYSLLVGRLALGVDVRGFGDHNPGAANVWRAGGWGWGVLAMLLDGFKGALPVGFAWFFGGVHAWQIVPVALAPVLGHAFSPWLGFHGGKAVAVVFGMWAGLTLGAGPTVLGMLLGVMVLCFAPSGWALILALGAFGVYILQVYGAIFPQFPVIWAASSILLVCKHLDDLRQPVRLRLPWRSSR